MTCKNIAEGKLGCGSVKWLCPSDPMVELSGGSVGGVHVSV